MIDYLALSSIFIGLFFFLAGSIGLLRLSDFFSRLHALAKADNVGLAFIMIGVAMLDGDPLNILKILMVWILVLVASSVSSHLIARHAKRGRQPGE